MKKAFTILIGLLALVSLADRRGQLMEQRPNGVDTSFIASPYLYYSFTNGSLTATQTVRDVSGNNRVGVIATNLTSLTSAGIIGFGCTNTANPNSSANPFIAFFKGIDASDFPSLWTCRFWIMLDDWDYANNYYSGSGAFGVVPCLAFKYGSNASKKAGVGAWNLGPATNISLFLYTNFFYSADVGTSNPIRATSTGTNLLLHTWYDVALTWDGSTVTLYCQGQSVASAIKDCSANSSFDFGGDELFSGRYDEIGIWNDRCWTAAQVLSDYNSGAGRTFP